jgi:hypothetical protein
MSGGYEEVAWWKWPGTFRDARGLYLGKAGAGALLGGARIATNPVVDDRCRDVRVKVAGHTALHRTVHYTALHTPLHTTDTVLTLHMTLHTTHKSNVHNRRGDEGTAQSIVQHTTHYSLQHSTVRSIDA